MTVDGIAHTKRVDAGDDLQRLLRERLEHTPPETSGPTVPVGTLCGLAVLAQAITTIEDEVRVTVPEAHIDVRLIADDLHRSDSSNLITRLERQIHRLPDSVVELHKEAAAANTEAQRAEARVGASWDRRDELAGLRRRQQEINEQFAASTEPPPSDHDTPATPPVPTADGPPDPRSASSVQPSRSTATPSDATPSAADPAALERMTRRLDGIEHRARLDPPSVGL